METNLRAFMRPDLKADKDRTMEFPGIKKFCDSEGEPIPFILKCLTRKQIKDIRNLYKTKKVFRDKKNGGRPMINNGEVVYETNYDAEKAGLHIMVEAFVQPKLDDAELMDYYGVLNRLDMPEVIFSTGEEFQYANECVMEACGLTVKKTDEEVVEDIKN